jgi:hypothetical protein
MMIHLVPVERRPSMLQNLSTRRLRALGAIALAAALALPLAATPAAAQRWDRGRDHHRGGWHGDGWGGGGAVVGGALLGLGIGAAVGSALAPPPPVYYAPPPTYSAPPPVYYYPPPA